MRNNVGLLVIIGAAPFPDLARAFVTCLPVVEQFLQQHKSPFIAKVYRRTPAETARRGAGPGRVELWHP
jgi:hypothetical protein